MGSYREQYEKYYGNVKKHGGAAQYRRAGTYEPANIQMKDKKYNLSSKIAKKIIWQLSGAAVLLITVLAITYIPVEGSENRVNLDIKSMIKEDIDISSAIMHLNIPDGEGYKENALDCIDEIKSSISGNKTLKQLIREDYIQPVSGKIKYINGDSKGIAISAEGEQNIVAVYSGTVEEIRDEEDNRCIVINHGNGTETYYGSLSEVNVEVGNVVEKGDVIGKCGIIDSTDKKGVIFKFIYLGTEKDPSDIMDLTSLEEV
ncbi:MAG: M23 family metallopeptidase [Clostridium sp.]|nr:M23 family metallopeptidase [Clostridium sp.]